MPDMTNVWLNFSALSIVKLFLVCAWRLTPTSFTDGLPEMSNFYCLTGIVGGSPFALDATPFPPFLFHGSRNSLI